MFVKRQGWVVMREAADTADVLNGSHCPCWSSCPTVWTLLQCLSSVFVPCHTTVCWSAAHYVEPPTGLAAGQQVSRGKAWTTGHCNMHSQLGNTARQRSLEVEGNLQYRIVTMSVFSVDSWGLWCSSRVFLS